MRLCDFGLATVLREALDVANGKSWKADVYGGQLLSGNSVLEFVPTS